MHQDLRINTICRVGIAHRSGYMAYKSNLCVSLVHAERWAGLVGPRPIILDNTTCPPYYLLLSTGIAFMRKSRSRILARNPVSPAPPLPCSPAPPLDGGSPAPYCPTVQESLAPIATKMPMPKINRYQTKTQVFWVCRNLINQAIAP